MFQKHLIIIGAGPKALAIAAKNQVLQQMGVKVPKITLIEELGIAAHWTAKGGLTTGKLPMGTSPEKDLGFPYFSQIFADSRDRLVDKLMQDFSFRNFLIDQGQFADFVDGGSPQPLHQDWANYLKSVAAKIDGLRVVLQKATSIKNEKEGYRVHLEDGKSVYADGVVLTGPGPERFADIFEAGDRVFTGRQINLLGSIPSGARVALVGAGESAASAAQALMSRDLEIDLWTPYGMIFSRGEGFFENQIYSGSRSGAWATLSEEQKRNIIRRTDRGVFSQQVIGQINAQKSLRICSGRVHSIRDLGHKVYLMAEHNGVSRAETYDYVVSAMGFNPRQMLLDLYDFRGEVRVDEALRLKGTGIHVPMLAGLDQGPGFANLSCLGLLSDRLLSPYLTTASLHLGFKEESSLELAL